MDIGFTQAPRDPAGRPPSRRSNSIRRTSTIDTCWPDGFGAPMRMIGSARDLLTRAPGDEVVLARAMSSMAVSARREILDIVAEPAGAAVRELIGVRAGGHSRAALAKLLPDAGTPLYLLLDDFAGATLVAGWVWSLWTDDWPAFIRESGLADNLGRRGVIEGVCTGFAPGSTALDAEGQPNHAKQNATAVEDLADPDDPLGWHPLAGQHGVAMRRARRIDVWCEADLIHIDAGFQDSGTSPDGGRAAVHEYRLTATADRRARTLLSLEPRAHILPFAECPGATGHVRRLVGQRLEDLRSAVLDLLPGVLGCTHLNDMLRSLAGVPYLLDALEERITAS